MHNPDKLMAHDGALDNAGLTAVEWVQVAPADAAGGYLQDKIRGVQSVEYIGV